MLSKVASEASSINCRTNRRLSQKFARRSDASNPTELRGNLSAATDWSKYQKNGEIRIWVWERVHRKGRKTWDQYSMTRSRSAEMFKVNFFLLKWFSLHRKRGFAPKEFFSRETNCKSYLGFSTLCNNDHFHIFFLKYILISFFIYNHNNFLIFILSFTRYRLGIEETEEKVSSREDLILAIVPSRIRATRQSRRRDSAVKHLPVWRLRGTVKITGGRVQITRRPRLWCYVSETPHAR